MDNLSQLTFDENFRSGYVAVFGRPNVGKSTLVNSILGQKISIVSEKPQTTRDRVLCIYEDDDSQIIFLDTPGMHKPRDVMNEYMVSEAKRALEDADVAVVLLDASEGFGPGDRYLATWLRESAEVPIYLVVNKIDLIPAKHLRKLSNEIPEPGLWTEQFFISALNGEGVEEFMKSIKSRIPSGPPFYPQGTLTDKNQRYMVGELIREKVFLSTRQEVPYSTAVVVQEFKEREQGKWFISATIYVEAESQKGIIVGKGGTMIKTIGAEAREEIEQLIGHSVFLDLRVKVRKKWRKNIKDLKEFGYKS